MCGLPRAKGAKLPSLAALAGLKHFDVLLVKNAKNLAVGLLRVPTAILVG
jgi:hypothetical protein